MITNYKENRVKTFIYIFCVAVCQILQAGDTGQWPKWRGPDDNGMARGDAPLHWSDTENIKWKAAIPGRGHSSPVLWGDKIFLTTAIPTDPAKAPAPGRSTEQRPRGQRGNPGAQPENRFEVLRCSTSAERIEHNITFVARNAGDSFQERLGFLSGIAKVFLARRGWDIIPKVLQWNARHLIGVLNQPRHPGASVDQIAPK